MHRFLHSLQSYPPTVVAAVNSWDLWKSLNGRDLSNQCDWVELRVDGLPAELSPTQVMEYRPQMPLLITVRSQAEGGLRPMTDAERFSLMRAYLPYAKALDIEAAVIDQCPDIIAEAKAAGIIIIASSHDFQLTPGIEYLREQEKKARECGADIVKFAFRLNEAADIQTGVELFGKATEPLAVMGMGPLGPVSRLLYSQLGSCLIYGYIGDEEAAPGQWHVSLIKNTLFSLPPTV